MQLGREAEAKQQLESAFKTDPFHVRVSNALKVLKHLDRYESKETAHFVIKFDSKTDKVFAAWLADYLEELHAEFAKLYGFAPPGKTLVEVMASREMFSGRVLSLPGLPGAQGASTGPLIAHAVATRGWPRQALQLGGGGAARTDPRLQPDPDRLPRPNLAHGGASGPRRAYTTI